MRYFDFQVRPYSRDRKEMTQKLFEIRDLVQAIDKEIPGHPMVVAIQPWLQQYVQEPQPDR